MAKKIINPLLGQHLAALRQVKGWSQPKLAELSGIPLGTIREIEQGNREPLLSTLQKLKAALGFDLNELPPSTLE